MVHSASLRPHRAAVLLSACLLAGCQQTDRLGVADGFNLWLGKTLAELFVVLVLIGVPAVLIGVLHLAGRVSRHIRRGRK